MTAGDTRPAGNRPALHIVNRYYHPDLSATAQIASDVGADLAQRGWQVTAHPCPWWYEGDAARLPAREEAGGVTIHRLRTTGFGRSSGIGRLVDYATYHLAIALRLLFAVRRGDIIICKTDPPMLSVTVAIIAALRGARVINWVQDLFPEVADAMLPAPVRHPLKALRDWSLRRAKANVVIGDLMRDRLVDAGVREAAIHLIPNWADPAIVPIDRNDTPLRAAWGIADGVTTVAYSGNLGFAHDHATMLGAARLLRDRADIVFLMIGGGAGMRTLEAAVAAEGLGNVRFLPYQPRDVLPQSLAAGDIHWLSLRPAMEGLIVPSKLYGIVSAGRPFLFVGDAGGEVARFIARHGGGAVVAEGDSAAFAAHITAWADAPQTRLASGAAAAAAAAAYSRDSAFAAWDAVVGSVASDALSAPVQGQPTKS